ncbi:MAG: hypothetical protein Q9186_007520 [Xanthomendoza sp. 1 TL-2023]
MAPKHQNINPCEDFSEFVCGGWEQKYDLRADQDSVSSGSVMYENSQRALRHLLESPYSDPEKKAASSVSADKHIFDKIQSAYNACMDEKTIRKIGAEPLLDILRKLENSYPPPRRFGGIVSSPNTIAHEQKGLMEYGNDGLTRAVSYLSKIGVPALVAFSIDADEKDPDSVVLKMDALDRPGLPSKEYYLDQGLLKDYAETIGTVLEALLREARPTAELSSETTMLFECSKELVKAVVDLEKNLALASPDEADAEDVTKYYNPRSLDEVRALLPQVSLPYLLSILAPPGFVPGKIIVGSPSYLEALSQQLENATYETLRAYLVWKTVQAYVGEAEDEALVPLKRFNNKLQGKDPNVLEERWRTCVKAVDRGLGKLVISLDNTAHCYHVAKYPDSGWILSKFFVEEAFSPTSKAFGDQVIHDIKNQFVKKLLTAEWMSKDVRDVAIDKVHRIIQKIGYPTRSPNLLDATAIEKYYDQVSISNSSYFGNALAVAEFDSRREWSKLGKPTNRDEWLMTAVTVNVGRHDLLWARPKLTSSKAGRHYDENGNYTDWWDSPTIQAFESKTQCFIEQYSKFTILDPDGKRLHVNGKLTLGENIADAGGLSAAFHAWKEIEEKQPSQLLPGLQHFTKEQMFFITYPSLFCGKTRQERAVNLIYKDPHSPSWARIQVSG